MRYSSVLALLTGAVLVLAGCGQQSVTPPVNPPVIDPGKGGGEGSINPTIQGKLTIQVAGVATAKVQVVGDGKTAFEGDVAAAKEVTLSAGSYVVAGAELDGFKMPSVQLVSLNASGATVKLTYTPQTVHPPSPAPAQTVTKVELFPYSDATGAVFTTENNGVYKDPLVGFPEIVQNPSKPAMMFASQQEERVCVTIRATDRSGAAVAGAKVKVNSSVFGVPANPGCPFLPGWDNGPEYIVTDSKGIAVFNLFAMNGLSARDFVRTAPSDPIKYDVMAGSGSTELKFFFINISHLYYQIEKGTRTLTSRRVANVLNDGKPIINYFKPLTPTNISENNPEENTFSIDGSVDQKQPNARIRDRFDSISYIHEITGTAAQLALVDVSNCSDIVATPTKITCTDSDGFVSVAPKPTVGLEDLPLQVSVKTTLYANTRYGTERYSWPLKDYIVTKRWVGTYLTIDKSIDHHVLTWAGRDDATKYTLASSDASEVSSVVNGDQVLTSEVTLTVRNRGSEPAYNITVRDALPAELGFLNAGATPGGVTYDGINHVSTWNDQNTGSPLFAELAGGATITVKFKVYIRQKPGFCWDADAWNLSEGLSSTGVRVSRGYQVKSIAQEVPGQPTTSCPSDPYKVVNGNQLNDVTAAWYTGKPRNQGGFEGLVDFNPLTRERSVEIWGVRPLLTLTKRLTSPNRREVGQDINYTVTLTNQETRARYADLRARYPHEFNAALAGTDGVRGRDNPYAINLKVADVFDRGIDYVSATNIAVSNNAADAGPNFVPAASAVRNLPAPFVKGFDWANIAIMGGGDTAVAEVTLTGNLPSPRGGWNNCAFADGRNLNQPDLETAPGLVLNRRSPTRLFPNNPLDLQPNLDPDWRQVHGPLASPRHGWAQDPLLDNNAPTLRSGIRDCVPVVIFQPLNPWIELTPLGEQAASTVPVPSTSISGIKVGSTYFYTFEVSNNSNTSDATATMVGLTVGLTGPAQFSTTAGDHLRYTCTVAGNTSTGCAAPVGATSATATSVVFPATDRAVNESFVYFIRTVATGAGNAVATATANYTNPITQLPLLPLVVTDNTSIAP